MKKNINKSLIIKTIIFSTILCLILLLIPELAAARPGGGHSYSGGSSGGSGGDGIGGLIIYLIMTLPPEISIPLIIIIVILYYISKRKKSQGNVTVASVPTRVNRSNEFQSTEAKIEQLKSSDPNFSKTLFLDFVTSLYYKYYGNYSKAEFASIRPFLAQSIFESAARTPANSRRFSEIVIGNLKIIALFQSSQYASITVDIDSNYTLTLGGRNTRYIVTERWLFNRKNGVQSQGPESLRDLKCPNCGAASNFSDAGKCEYCDTFIEAGEMQWFVSQINILRQETFSTKGLGHYEQEVGTDYPTIVQPSINNYINRFVGIHKLTDWNSYWNNFTDNVASAYFKEIYKAWNDLKWERVRHLISDRLHESYSFWIKAYKQENLRNRLDNINIQRIDMAAIDVDNYYESFTVRIFASCLDYVEDTSGRLIGGSKKQPRVFSEYWTFIRRTGVENKKTEFSLNNCPNCGAPADKMGQAAVCEYCNSKISTGEFSWVLARIVQDEEYTG